MIAARFVSGSTTTYWMLDVRFSKKPVTMGLIPGAEAFRLYDTHGFPLELTKDVAREHGLTYSRFMNGLVLSGIELDRKVLSDIAIHEPATFAGTIQR